MPSVTFRFVNGTHEDLQLLNSNPSVGWGPQPQDPLPAHRIPRDAVFNATDQNITISYGPAAAPHNMAYLAGAGGPTVHTTPNTLYTLHQVGADYVVTLTYN